MNDLKEKIFNIFAKSLSKKVNKKLSFSQFQNWSKCPHLHYLISISKKIPYPDNDYTAYGFPIHEVLQKMMLEYAVGESCTPQENYQYFLKKYEENVIKILEEGNIDKEDLSHDNIIKFSAAAKSHIGNIIEYLQNTFGTFEIVVVEEDFDFPLDIETENYTFSFRGMIDLVIQTSDGVYHVIDWKTSNNGWSEYKKNKNLYLDQLLFYKFFFHKKFNIPLDQIKSHFIILESTNKEIDKLSLDVYNKDIEDLFKRLRVMIYNAFEKRKYPKTGMCGNFCDCKNYYLNLTGKE